VVFEMPRPQFLQAQRVAFGLTASVERWCGQHDVICEHTWPATIKKFATGNGACGKDAVIEAVKKRWKSGVRDDNEADAIALLMWAANEFKVQTGGCNDARVEAKA
jgi:Holliday junction resolvasome RuvABC endonuclease subunit